MMDRDHVSSVDYTFATLYKMAGGATGTTLGLVRGYRKPVLTNRQRLQQEFEAPWLRLLRIVSVDVEDLAGAEAALKFVATRLEKLEADARQSEQQSEARRGALDAAETRKNAVQEQLNQLQQDLEEWRADGESKLTAQDAAMQDVKRNFAQKLQDLNKAYTAIQVAFHSERKAKDGAHSARAAAEDALARNNVALTELKAANLRLQADVAQLESECKANEAAFADEQMAKTEAQAALAEKASDISRMQAALTAVPEEKQALVARIESQCKAKEEAHSARAAAEDAAARNDVALTELRAANLELQANVARLESECKANEAAFADEQMAKTEAQAALAEKASDISRMQAASEAVLKARQAVLARLESECKASEAALAEEQKGKTEAQAALAEQTLANQKLCAALTASQEERQAAVAQLESERKASLAALATEQEGKILVQASLEIAQEGAKRMSATKSALEQEVQRMAQQALAREARLKQDKGTVVESLKAALAEAQKATQTAEANLLAECYASSNDQERQAQRILKLGSVMDKKDDHVASLQAMVVYYRDLCGMPIKLGKMSVYDEPDPDEYYPLQDLDFSMGEEPPADQQDHYMELTRRCVDNRRDPINALDRWLPKQTEVESVGEGLRMSANRNEKLKSQTTAIAIKMFQNNPKALFDKESSQLCTARACKNVVKLIKDTPPLWDGSTRRGYMFLEFAQGGDLEDWLVNIRQKARIDFPTRAHECVPYTPPQQAQVVSMIRDIFQGLQQLHALNIVHNDVKPHNCLLKHKDNFLKLADLANSVQLQTGLPGALFEVSPEGTEEYMAPERLAVWCPEMCLPQKGQKYTAQEVFAGDVWAGGITAFRLLLGRPYTLTSCSPSNFHLERDAQQMTTALQRHKRGLCQQDALLQHVSQVWGRDAVDLLAGLLLYDPAERCTAAQALAMPFLAGNVSGVS